MAASKSIAASVDTAFSSALSIKAFARVCDSDAAGHDGSEELALAGVVLMSLVEPLLDELEELRRQVAR